MTRQARGEPQTIWRDGWQIGRNVPWSVAWTGEQSFRLQSSTDFPALFDLVQEQRPGAGTPKFAQLHLSRLRRGIAEHLCHVCGRRTLRGDRYIFPVQTGGIMPADDETSRYVGNIPPVHLACARAAQRLCPHLIEHRGEPVAFPSEETRLMPRRDIVPGLEDVARRLPRGVAIAFSCYRLYGPRFTAKVRDLREDARARTEG